MSEHLEDGELDTHLDEVGVTGGDTAHGSTHGDHDESHVADGGVCDHLLEVPLGDTGVRTVDHGDDSDGDDDVLPAAERTGEGLDADSDDTVGTHLKHDSGQEDGTGGRRLDVCVRQPGMEGNRGHLDSESEEQHCEHEDLEHRVGSGHPLLHECEAEVDGSAAGEVCRLEDHAEDSDQHDQRCYVGVDEELDGRVVPPGTSVPRDKEVHRNQADLPHDVEEEVVCREVNSHQSDLDGQEQCVEVVGPVALLVGEGDDQHLEHCGEEDHQEAESVDGQDDGHLESGGVDPAIVHIELGEVVDVGDHQYKGEQEGRYCEHECHSASVLLPRSAHEESNDGSDQGHQDKCG